MTRPFDRILVAALGIALAVGAAMAQSQASPATTKASTTTATAPATNAVAVAADANLPPPTRVTLRLRAAPATQAFKDLFRQADVRVTETMERSLQETVSDLTVTADLVDVPFLVALIELSRQCHVDPYFNEGSDGRFRLINRRPPRPSTRPTTWPTTRPATTRRFAGGPGSRPFPTTLPSAPFGPMGFRRPTSMPTSRPMFASPTTASTRPSWVDAPMLVRGPFVLAPRTMARMSRVWLESDEPQTTQSMELSIQLMSDPRVRMFELVRELEVEVAQDEQGRSLMLPPPEGRRDPPRAQQTSHSDDWLWSITARLGYPPPDSRRIALLRGTVRAAVVTQSAAIEVNDFKVPGERRAGDLRVNISQPRETREGFALPVTLFRDGRDDESWRQIRDLARDRGALRVTDEAGRPMGVFLNDLRSGPGDVSLVGEIQLRSETTLGVKRERKPPAKLIWDVPVEVRDISIPLEFKDLELP